MEKEVRLIREEGKRKVDKKEGNTRKRRAIKRVKEKVK